MTHRDLVDRAVRWLRGYHKCRVVLAECVAHSAGSIPDAIGWRSSGYCILIECKMSRSDLRKDAKKDAVRTGRVPGTERWYLAPDGVLSPDVIPEGWGLAVHKGRGIYPLLAPNRRESSDTHLRPDVAILVAALRRHELGIEWHHAEARFEPYAPRPASRHQQRRRWGAP